MVVRSLELATQAFIYGYPLVYDLTEVTSQVTAPKVTFTAPVNMFGAGRELAGPADEFVSLNNDTVYAMAHVDVTNEPQVLHLPDTHDRYYVMQFVDAWSNNFAYVGRRATGTAEQWWLLAGPDWEGTVPDGMGLITAPTNVFSIVGRFAVNGNDDLPAVFVLEDDTWLTPLSLYPSRPDTTARAFGDFDVAPYDRDAPEDIAWWEKFRAWSQLFPAANPAELDPFASLGILESTSPYHDVDPELRAILVQAQTDGFAAIDRAAKGDPDAPPVGWQSALHLFDYNTTSFQVGTIDVDEWKIADLPTATMVRAIAAYGGLWGNHGYEAAYLWTFTDEEGQLLIGEHAYTVHFDEVPPVDAFWSMTMYDDEKFYLVENPIDRYSIGDRTAGLRYNDDGSLDLFIQASDPGGERSANWLPCPAGGFRPLIRMYQPGASVLDDTYVLPPFVRVK